MKNINDDYEKIKAWFDLQAKHVQANAKIVDTDLVSQGYMLHIDKVMPEVFIPRMPKTGPDEANETTPRVTVAPNLIGCYIGYGRAETDFSLGSTSEALKEEGYKGGYDICKFEFMHCIQPNNTLICEASRSMEYWLVPYSEETLEYKPVKIGKMFISEISHVAKSKSTPSIQVTMYVESNSEDGFSFCPKTYLEQGFYKIEVCWPDAEMRDCKGYTSLVVEKITKEAYEEVKTLKASLLSYVDTKAPAYAKW